MGSPRFSPRRRQARCSLLPLLLAACLVVVACSSSTPADPSTVNFLIESMPTNLDPRIGTDANSQYLDGLIFSSLVARDSQMNIVADLAQSWDTPDPLTYVLHLRSGVQFHDGRPLTSADVKFTFDSILSGDVKTPKRGSFRLVSSIDAPDPATIVFHLREPYASFLWNLTRPGVGIVPRGSTPAEMSQHPIGSGPFRFVSAITDEEVVLARNPNYFGAASAAPSTPSLASPAQPAPAVEGVRFRIVPDAIVRALELRKGSADVTMNALSPDMVVALAKEKNIQADQQPGTMLAYIAFNFEDKILSHREVRQALAFATDRNTLIEYLFRGQARPASNLLPPSHWAFEPNVPQYPYDPARAEQLLDAAGFPRDPAHGNVRFHLELKSSTEESARLLGEAIADQWKRVGIALDLRPLEFATFYSDITRGSFQLYTHRWVGGNNDPDMFDFVFSSKKFPPDGANRGHYKNAALDQLLDAQRVEMDREKRKVILSQIQKIVSTDEPYIDLFYLDNVCVHRSRLANISISPTGDYEFLQSATLR